jgi:hypothetical protein
LALIFAVRVAAVSGGSRCAIAIAKQASGAGASVPFGGDEAFHFDEMMPGMLA